MRYFGCDENALQCTKSSRLDSATKAKSGDRSVHNSETMKRDIST